MKNGKALLGLFSFCIIDNIIYRYSKINDDMQYNIKQVKGSTQGSVLFLGPNASISENSTQLYWDSTNSSLNIVGTLYATSKSFEITHPLDDNKRLTYGSLEGPEYGVYYRGKLDNEHIIELPDYWTALIDENSITVSLTPFGIYQNLFVEKVENNKVYVGSGNSGLASCYYVVYAERKDIPKIIIEK